MHAELIDAELLRLKLWPDVAARISTPQLKRLARKKLIPSEMHYGKRYFNPNAVRAALQRHGITFQTT